MSLGLTPGMPLPSYSAVLKGLSVTFSRKPQRESGVLPPLGLSLTLAYISGFYVIPSLTGFPTLLPESNLWGL